MNRVSNIAIVGCQGIPAHYGGYETLVEYLAEFKPPDLNVTVFCSRKIYSNNQPKTYKSVNLEYINLPSNGLMSSFYDMWSILKSIHRFDKILILGSSGGFILPFLARYREKFVLNIGGIEWKRSKYNLILQQIVRILMRVSVHNSGYLIADNEGIKEYIFKEYSRLDSRVIAYGGDQACRMPITDRILQQYPFLSNKYAIAIARIQSDNNIEMLLEAFKFEDIPLVYIGNWNVSNYAIKIREKYSKFSNLILLDAIYDLDILNTLRSNCYLYLHAHSAGGTNPSLVEAMHLRVPILCFDNIFNRNVTENKTKYFTSATDLSKIVKVLSQEELSAISNELYNLAVNKYTWKSISESYYDFICNGKLENLNQLNYY